jgi:hypothetical protein
MSTQKNQSVVSDSPVSSEVTVYLGGPALVRERRHVSLPEGKSEVSLAGLPEQLVPNSITITHVDGAGNFKLGPFSYRPANLSVQAILAKAVGTTVTIMERDQNGEKNTTGKLVHVIHNQAVIEEASSGKVVIVPIGNRYSVDPSVLQGLTSLASLVMEPTVSKAGEFGIGIMYAAEGLSWANRFEVFYDAAAEKLIRFACWVDLTNNSGAAIGDTKFKLIAGHNNGYYDQQMRNRGAKGGMRPMAMAASLGGSGLESASMSFDSAEVESVGEQKLYTLPDSLALENGETKQTVLALSENVPVKPEYYLQDSSYYLEVNRRRNEQNKIPVHVRLKVANTKAANLGFALPSGSVNIFEPDSSGSLQRTDSSSLSSHVAAGEAFTLHLNTPSKDIKATRRLTRQIVDPVVVESEEVVEEGGLDTANGGIEAQPTPATTGMRPAVTATVAAPASAAKKVKKEKKPRYAEEDRELVIHNYKDKDVEVQVTDQLPSFELQFLKAIDGVNNLVQAQGAGSFTVNVPKGGKTVVTYTIKYRVE